MITVGGSGGMCVNPFGGHAWVGKLDVAEMASGGCTAVALLMRSVILDAVGSYLYFGLGKNGMIAEEFLWASEYFFKVTSNAPPTWSADRRLKVADGQNKTFVDLTDAEMRLGCFDIHYELSGMDRAVSLETFRRMLRDKRRQIIEENLAQVREYLQEVRSAAAKKGRYLRSGHAHRDDLVGVMVSPSDAGLAAWLYPVKTTVAIPSPFRLPNRIRGRREWTSGSQYQRAA
jgi:hypothetical protein